MTVYKLTMTIASAYEDISDILTSDEFAEAVRYAIERVAEDTAGVTMASSDLSVQLPADPSEVPVVYRDEPGDPDAPEESGGDVTESKDKPKPAKK